MNAFDMEGYNCLHRAASLGHANIVEILAAHKHGRAKNLYWDEDYLDKLTNTLPQVTALQIACQRKDKKCVDILLKYGAKQREKTNDEMQRIEILQKYCIMKQHQKDELSFSSELDVISWEQFFNSKNLLSNVMNEGHIFNCIIQYSNTKCCKIEKNIASNRRRFLNLCIAQKCLKCIIRMFPRRDIPNLQLSIASFQDVRILIQGSIIRTDNNMFDVIRYLCESNVNISDYLLNLGLHGCILENLPRESVRMLFRAYGMKQISSSDFSLWVRCYWQLEDYETIGLLHMAVQKFAVCDYVSEYAKYDKSLVNPLLLDCIKQSTCVDTDLSSQTNLECLKYAAKHPRTLQNLCIISVRQSICENVIYNVQHLPLPNVLKKKIVLANDIKENLIRENVYY